MHILTSLSDYSGGKCKLNIKSLLNLVHILLLIQQDLGSGFGISLANKNTTLNNKKIQYTSLQNGKAGCTNLLT